MVHQVASAAEFHEQVKSGKVVVVDFFATWCGPCRFVAPTVEAFSKKYTNAVFLKVDVDQVPDLAAECEIQAMPTFQIFKGGKKIDEVIGADVKKLEAAIASALA